MITTRSPGRCSVTIVPMMSSIDSAARADWPWAREVADTNSGRDSRSGLGQRRPEHRRDQHFVRRRQKCAREIVLKHAAARRSRTRLEHRPDPRVRIGGAQAGQRFGDRRRVVREIVVDGHAAGDADDLEPPLHAGETTAALRRSARRSCRRRPRRRSPPARSARCARRPAAPRRRPNGVPRPDLETRPTRPALRSCACQSAVLAESERLDA